MGSKSSAIATRSSAGKGRKAEPVRVTKDDPEGALRGPTDPPRNRILLLNQQAAFCLKRAAVAGATTLRNVFAMEQNRTNGLRP